METMIAYKGQKKLKGFIVGQLKAHHAADEIVQGLYWENGKGCAVGCTIEAIARFNKIDEVEHSKHALYETYLGIPRVLAYLEDRIFEGLSNGEAKEWPVRFASAIRVGADLSQVIDKFLFWLCDEFLPTTTKNERSLTAIKTVADLYRRKLAGEEVSRQEWKDAAYDAYDADDAYAYAAAAVADAYADDAYTYAAYTYAYGRKEARSLIVNKLIEILKAA